MRSLWTSCVCDAEQLEHCFYFKKVSSFSPSSFAMARIVSKNHTTCAAIMSQHALSLSISSCCGWTGCMVLHRLLFVGVPEQFSSRWRNWNAVNFVLIVAVICNKQCPYVKLTTLATLPHRAIHSNELIHRSHSLSIGGPYAVCSLLFAPVLRNVQNHYICRSSGASQNDSLYWSVIGNHTLRIVMIVLTLVTWCSVCKFVCLVIKHSWTPITDLKPASYSISSKNTEIFSVMVYWTRVMRAHIPVSTASKIFIPLHTIACIELCKAGMHLLMNAIWAVWFQLSKDVEAIMFIFIWPGTEKII